MSRLVKIALVGNPNSGKTSLFNILTGLNQRVGNYPGVTMDRKVGYCQWSKDYRTEVIDLPGVYSLFPRTQDELIVSDILLNVNHADHPDLAIVLADATNLERNLLLYSQVKDLGIPAVLLLTMEDVAAKQGISVDLNELSRGLEGVPVVMMNTRNGHGLRGLRDAVVAHNLKRNEQVLSADRFNSALGNADLEQADILGRYAVIKETVKGVVTYSENVRKRFSFRVDRLLLHPLMGYMVFFSLLLMIFEGIFTFAAYPMDWMDSVFGSLSHHLSQLFPQGPLSDLLTRGVIPGIGGVLIFIPQLAILFFCLSILEESGYMARVVFLNDRLMRPFGLNGRSIVPLMSSVACAVPGIISARAISSRRDRLITIFVAPLMSCSARIPVYTLLIALVIPEFRVAGIFDSRSLVMFCLYLLGFISALLLAAGAKYILKTPERSFLILELPEYRIPRWGAVFATVYQKIWVFCRDAGKIILLISVVLWCLSSYGPTNESVIPARTDALHDSYIGYLGSAIEPVIRPLGYDWKIGIALLTSFAAREIFVGSMATIYGAGEGEGQQAQLLDLMRMEVFTDTGMPVYTLASGLSLLVFYVYAMQCMATMAAVRRETGGWKWPLLQMGFLGLLAYLGAFVVYSIWS
jgi:ferrous iron transport protein B